LNKPEFLDQQQGQQVGVRHEKAQYKVKKRKERTTARDKETCMSDIHQAGEKSNIVQENHRYITQ
jgi:hypothetical protein